LSITALGARQLDAMGADGFAGFSRTVPGLVLNQGDPGRGSFSIRGVSTGLGIGDNQAPVALYVDELPTDDSRGARSIADLSLFDVKRVEILRGPQGTLFGSGALGGAIRVLTNGPDLNRLEGRVLGDYWLTEGGAASGTVKGMVNAPLIADRLAVRAVGYYRDVGGYVDNLGTGRSNVNGDTSYGGRIS
ncbi:TonB-dependent receptor plug domain-containing protein, partial [Ralstonia pseudosolanacearum]|uniref:TonB-dependent receptor plug domain-containing protein n=3 Tax=Bacteria TaxID=2 RepID=UPI003D180B00